MSKFEPVPERTEHVAKDIVNAAYRVHKTLGPGLLEHVYERCLMHELSKIGRDVKRQEKVAVHYDGITIDDGLRLDLLVDDRVICELKSVEEIHEVYKAQLLTYLRLTNKRLGLLINFNVAIIKNGIRRIIL